MSQVRAKFVVNEVNQNEDGSSKVSMSPVTSGTEENKSWSTHTPSGKLEMDITNPDATFEVGSEYYLDFTKAEANSDALVAG